jgi:hypothetical protein
MINNLVEFSAKARRLLDGLSLESKVVEIDDLGLSLGPIKTILGLWDLHFMYKLARFVRAFEDVPEDEIDRFVSRLQNEEVYRHKVGASLLELRLLEDDLKANWLGKLTLAYSRGVFNEEKFDVLRYSIRNTYAQDLHELLKFYEVVGGDPNSSGLKYENKLALQRLAGTGLLSGPTTALSGIIFHLNEYGKLMVENALMDDMESK